MSTCDYATTYELEPLIPKDVSKPVKTADVIYVVKRDGRMEPFDSEKIANRIHQLSNGLTRINIDQIVKSVARGLVKNMPTHTIDDHMAKVVAAHVIDHVDYSLLAARISVSNMHKMTPTTFSECISILYNGGHNSAVSKSLYDQVCGDPELYNSAILGGNDYKYDFFGFKTLERAYLLKHNGRIVERPQYMLMRVSIGIHGNDVDSVLTTYQMMSEGVFTHATPTLYNAGTQRPGLSSCYLLTMRDDSIKGIFETLGDCAAISKSAGGIGLDISEIRAHGRPIVGTNGTSNGIVPMLRVFNNTARYVDQGGGKRSGAFAIYIPVWHADLESFLTMGNPKTTELLAGRELFYGLWVSDLFMERVHNDGMWSFMSPDKCPGLSDVHSEEFEKLYTMYEAQNKFSSQVKAQDVMKLICISMIESGGPYIMYKDQCNRKSNQQNLGTIRSSNLCTEIVQYTKAGEESSVCNLASIALPKFVMDDGEFDHERLATVVGIVTRNLNKVIDVCRYPIPEAERSNDRHRPIGIGVQGLADVFFKLEIPYNCPEARQLNKEIFETIYYGALKASNALAIKDGAYKSFVGSPASKGVLQFDMWNTEPSDRWNWVELKASIVENGLRNSLMVAPMPTATTAQILGNTEGFEPMSLVAYTRRTNVGEFLVVNPYFQKSMIDQGLWTTEMQRQLVDDNGSVQNLDIPQKYKDIYKTVFEYPAKDMLNMSAERGAFIDQSQSLNAYLAEPEIGQVASYLMYGYKLGLKTGSYYLRNNISVVATKFSRISAVEKPDSDVTCSIINREACEACSS